MTVLIVNIIGAGRVGKTLGSLLVRDAGIIIGGVCNKTLASAQQAVNFIGSGFACAQLNELPAADLTLLTTADNMIISIVEQICMDGINRPNSILVHCSGALSSEILSPLRTLGYSIAGCHPLRSFADPCVSISNFTGTYCAVEGDMQAVEFIQPLLNRIGAISHTITPQAKAGYHAAGVFASNYMVTLAQHAWVCLIDAGVDKNMALNMVVSLMQGTVAQIHQNSEPVHALTGPIQRGDTITVQSHLNALNLAAQKKLYSILGLETLQLTQLDADILDCLQVMLADNLNSQ